MNQSLTMTIRRYTLHNLEESIYSLCKQSGPLSQERDQLMELFLEDAEKVQKTLESFNFYGNGPCDLRTVFTLIKDLEWAQREKYFNGSFPGFLREKDSFSHWGRWKGKSKALRFLWEYLCMATKSSKDSAYPKKWKSSVGILFVYLLGPQLSFLQNEKEIIDAALNEIGRATVDPFSGLGIDGLKSTLRHFSEKLSRKNQGLLFLNAAFVDAVVKLDFNRIEALKINEWNILQELSHKIDFMKHSFELRGTTIPSVGDTTSIEGILSRFRTIIYHIFLSNASMSRRLFFVSAAEKTAAAIGGTAFATNAMRSLSAEEGKNPFIDPTALQKFFKANGVKPQIFNNGGTRTLLIIGEPHFKWGDDTVAFFRYMRKKFGNCFNKVFFEGVFVDPISGEDPFYGWYLINRKHDGFNVKTLQAFMKEDLGGYYRTKNIFAVRGIEKRQLGYETNHCEKIWEIALWELYDDRGSKNVDAEKKIFEIAKKITSITHPFKSFPLLSSKTFEEQQKSKKKIMKPIEKFSRTVYNLRHEHFVSYINEELKENEVGCLIIGNQHVLNDKDGFIWFTKSLPEWFKEKKINVVYIFIKDLLEFLEAEGLRK